MIIRWITFTVLFTILSAYLVSNLSDRKAPSSVVISPAVLQRNGLLLATWFILDDEPRKHLLVQGSAEQQLKELGVVKGVRLVRRSQRQVVDFLDMLNQKERHRIIAIMNSGDVVWVGDRKELNGSYFLQIFYRNADRATVWPEDSFLAECNGMYGFEITDFPCHADVEGTNLAYFPIQNFGILPLGKDLATSFSLSNLGNGDVTVTDFRSSCSCTSSDAVNMIIQGMRCTDIPIVLTPQNGKGISVDAKIYLDVRDSSSSPQSDLLKFKLIASEWSISTPSLNTVDFGLVDDKEKVSRKIELRETPTDQFEVISVSHSGFDVEITQRAFRENI